ncbi:MAG: type II toxin-antitoxin system VapC family toxin [Vicinamibacteria bacterium]
MLVLDTSAVSTVMHRQRPSLERLAARSPSEIVLAAPVAAEISFGLARLGATTRRRRLLEGEYRRLRELVRWADWNEAAAWQFGILKARLFERGRIIDDLDIAIGSIAIQLGARLATHNAKHFQALEGVEVEDWGPPHTGRG